MLPSTTIRRWGSRGVYAIGAVLALAAGALAANPAAGAVAAPTPTVSNPYSPAYQHAYRHGVTPTIPQAAKMRSWAAQHKAGQDVTMDNLSYAGGIDGIGVTSGKEKVYLVFYGSQWGTKSTSSNGDITLSGDSNGEAPYLQDFLKGLGTGGELWSGVLTQYCDGVAAGSLACPAGNSQHVPYPTGGALAGVWVDKSAASPWETTGHQLGVEAVNAAAHFGNTTPASNRDAQYIIASPYGTLPDGFYLSGFCAWHDYNGDPLLTGGPVTSAYGDLAFTNLPYIPMATIDCGQNYVNAGSAGNLDGVSIVEGHEYAETLTDQNPYGGWSDSTGNETGDKCAWIDPGSPGGAFDLATGTGSYAMQTTWANDGPGGWPGDCEAGHPNVGNGSNGAVTITIPASQLSTVGAAARLQVLASDSAPGQTLSYTAAGLPPGLSISSSSGLISGTPTAPGPYGVAVTATDTAGATALTTFTWTINPSSAQGILNGGFEAGTLSGWVASGPATAVVSAGAHSGSYAAEAGSPTSLTSGNSTVAQTFIVPARQTTVSFWYNVNCLDPFDDWASATLTDNTSGTTSTPLSKACPYPGTWTQVSAPVTAGHSYTLALTTHENGNAGLTTDTLFDDVSTH
jgi:hypothetical protein